MDAEFLKAKELNWKQAQVQEALIRFRPRFISALNLAGTENCQCLVKARECQNLKASATLVFVTHTGDHSSSVPLINNKQLQFLYI